MSWLFKSLQSSNEPDSPPQNSPTHRNANAAITDDLSVIGETIGRQLRGVAAFLAPPPTTTTDRQQPSSPSSSSSSQTLVGIRNDLVEIGGSFKSGLSRLSSNKAVSEISKLASNLLKFPNEDDDDRIGDYDGVPGITEEVLEFVKEISLRPECWTDFPISIDDDDFEMSDAQREHISAVEHLVPSFSDLRVNLHLQHYLRENQFWMIYIILLLPRLNEHDLELISTPKIIETRNTLLQKVQNKRSASNTPNSQKGNKVFERQVESEKEVSQAVSAIQGLEIDDEENTEQWLEDEDTDTGISVNTQKRQIEHEEEDDVSFSDLEDEDNDLHSRQSAHRSAQDSKATSPSGSSDWIRLNKSSENRGEIEKARQSISRDKDSEGESSDWLKVDDYD